MELDNYKYGLRVRYFNGFMFKFVPYALTLKVETKVYSNLAIIPKRELLDFSKLPEYSKGIKQLMDNYGVKYGN